jgi:ribose/xylose/arabinose/galactoside ABC-type transport system permease subunit
MVDFFFHFDASKERIELHRCRIIRYVTSSLWAALRIMYLIQRLESMHRSQGHSLSVPLVHKVRPHA